MVGSPSCQLEAPSHERARTHIIRLRLHLHKPSTSIGDVREHLSFFEVKTFVFFQNQDIVLLRTRTHVLFQDLEPAVNRQPGLRRGNS